MCSVCAFLNIICALAYMFVHVCAAANEDDCARRRQLSGQVMVEFRG